MTTFLRLFAWSLAAAVAFATLGPPEYRPHSSLGQNGEHALAFVLIGVAFGLAYTRNRAQLNGGRQRLADHHALTHGHGRSALGDRRDHGIRDLQTQADSRTDGATNDLTDRTADLTTGARPFPGALRGGRLCKRCT